VIHISQHPVVRVHTPPPCSSRNQLIPSATSRFFLYGIQQLCKKNNHWIVKAKFHLQVRTPLTMLPQWINWICLHCCFVTFDTRRTFPSTGTANHSEFQSVGTGRPGLDLHLHGSGAQPRPSGALSNVNTTKAKRWPYQLTNFTEQSPSDANSHSSSQEIIRLLWNTKVHYRVHKNPPLIPILSQVNPVLTSPPYFHKMHSNIMFLSKPMSSKRSLPFRFSTNIFYTLLISPIHATCPPISSSLIWSPE
jgi:hypothetical protein